jgi:hypothetical protein
LLLLSGEAATRFASTKDNAQLRREVTNARRPLDWSVWPIPVVPKESAESATEKPPMAVFPEGFLHYIIPAYNTGQRLDHIADFMMFLSVPDHIGSLVGEHGGFLPNIEDAPLPTELASLRLAEDATYWYVDSSSSTHVSGDLRDEWVENWRQVLLGGMTADAFTGTMQLLLEGAARSELE